MGVVKTCFILSIVLTLLVSIALPVLYNKLVILDPMPNGIEIGGPYAKAVEIQNVLLVGGTSGIGSAVAEVFLKMNDVNVVVVGRKEPVKLTGNKTYEGRIRWLKADLETTTGSKEAADAVKDIEFDVVLFTVGYTADLLQRSTEGIERDLAISFFSRHVVLRQMLENGMKDGARVFIMGSPGLPIDPSLDDINWENSYSMTTAHMNGHVFNEALVHYYVDRYPTIGFFGLNPGIILSDGFLSFIEKVPMAENIFRLVFPYQNEYAENTLVPLIGHPDIKSGSIFNQHGTEIFPNPWFNPRKENAEKIIKSVDALLRKLNLL